MKKFRARRAMKKRHKNIRLPPIDATDSLGFVGLMFAELIQALGGLLSIRWVANGVCSCRIFYLIVRLPDIRMSVHHRRLSMHGARSLETDW